MYIITGGLGGLGRVFAAYLAETAQAQLVLTGRSPLDREKEAKLAALRAHGVLPNTSYRTPQTNSEHGSLSAMRSRNTAGLTAFCTVRGFTGMLLF